MSGLSCTSLGWFGRLMAKFLILLLALPLAQASAQEQTPQNGAAQSQQQSATANSGNSAKAVEPALPNEPQQNHSLPQNAGTQPPPAQTPPAQQTQTPEPVGTAAAPAETPVGTAVSRPAGAAIAPAKQKRRRTFLIRVGLIVGAAVAVGTVVALSKASRSRP